MNEQGEQNGLRNLRKDLLVPAVSRRSQKGSTGTQGRQEDKRTQAASRNREGRQGVVSKKTQISPISFCRDLIVDTTRKDAQGAPRACTTSYTTGAPEQGRANPCRRRAVLRCSLPALTFPYDSVHCYSADLWLPERNEEDTMFERALTDVIPTKKRPQSVSELAIVQQRKNLFRDLVKGGNQTQTLSVADRYLRDAVRPMIWKKNTVTFPNGKEWASNQKWLAVIHWRRTFL